MAVLPVARTGNPGLTADVNAGFPVGAVWTNTTTKVTFVCLDNTAGAAVWSSNPRNRQTSGAPTVTDDITLGYAPGSLWTDTTAATVYVCISAALGAAVWNTVGATPVPPQPTPSFPLASAFPNVAAWELDPLGSPLWVSKRSTAENVANVVTGSVALGAPTLVNSGVLAASAFSSGVLSWGISAGQDWSTGGQTAAYLYWPLTLPFAYDAAAPVIAFRILSPAGLSGATAAFGVVISNDASPGTNYIRVLQGRTSSTDQCYTQLAGTFGNFEVTFAASTSEQQTGIWHRFIFNPTGSLVYQSATTNTDDYASVTGWTTRRTSNTASYAGSDTLRIGFAAASGALGATFTWTVRRFIALAGRSRGLLKQLLPGFGYTRTRASTAIPIFTENIGASATYSDAEVIARLSRAVNTIGDTATIRAYIKRGSDYSAPDDLAAGWVTYTGGTFAGLMTSGTGALLSIWIDASSTNGAQSWSFDPIAFGTLGVT